MCFFCQLRERDKDSQVIRCDSETDETQYAWVQSTGTTQTYSTHHDIHM